jgi:hypothetical protein
MRCSQQQGDQARFYARKVALQGQWKQEAALLALSTPPAVRVHIPTPPHHHYAASQRKLSKCPAPFYMLLQMCECLLLSSAFNKQTLNSMTL